MVTAEEIEGRQVFQDDDLVSQGKIALTPLFRCTPFYASLCWGLTDRSVMVLQ
jgi:hypothetical protein